MKVLVTGASGYIGGSVTTALLSAGHQVVGLVRSDERAAEVRARGIEPLIGTLDHLEHRADEVVAQNAKAGHHSPAVDARLAGLDPEYRGLADRVRRLGRGDQQLARHAADPGAGGAVRPALDQHQTVGVLAHFAP